MEDGGCTRPARLQLQSKMWGYLIMPLSIISLGIAFGLNAFITPGEGAWFVAVISFCTAVMGVQSRTHCVIVSVCVISIIAVILGIAASIIDGSTANALAHTEACASPIRMVDENNTVTYQYEYFGSSNYFYAASNCSYERTEFDCACVSSKTGDTCLYFDGQTNCDLISTKFVSMLRAATAFNVLTMLAVLGLSITSCCGICCPDNGCIKDTDTAEAAYVVNSSVATANYPNTIYVGTVQTSGPVTSPAEVQVSFAQHPQVAMLNQYNQQHQVTQATAVPVEYSKVV